MKKMDMFTSKEIKPRGWLKRQLEIQADGLSGNLDKVWRDVRDSAWIGGTAEGWERVPYWLDGFIPLAYLLENNDMIARAKKYIDAIISFQQPDGWICPCKTEEIAAYDTWAGLLIGKVLVVYYECSGDERIPAVVYRVLKNFYDLLKDGKIKLIEWGKYRWFEGFIPIDFLYQIYPEQWLIELAKILKEQGVDYNKLTHLWERPLNKWTFDTHIVNLAMMLKSETVSCKLLGQEYTDYAERLYRILKQYNGTPVESFTGDECLSGVSPIQGTELCSIVELMYSYELLYAYTDDKKWAERLEILAFNALPATISDDMWTHQYVQMSNQISCQKFPGKPLFRTNSEEAHLFGLEPHFGCCTANFGQGWPKLALSAFMCTENEIISTVPIPSELKTQDVHIVLDTHYPFDYSFKYTIESNRAFTFRVRIPSWAKNTTVDGKGFAGENVVFEIAKGEAREIHINYDVSPKLQKREYNLNTVQCGPLVFSVPIAYEKKLHEYEQDGVERKFPYCDYEYIPVSDWNYAYCSSDFKLEKRGVDEVPFSSQNPPVILKAYVKQIDWGFEDGYETVCAKEPLSRTPIGEKKEIALYPYGCAKLRMTELPMVE